MSSSLTLPPKTAQTRDAAPLKIHALTSVRFFAALYVILFHNIGQLSPRGFVAEIIKMGVIGPYFFFTLSGYILALVYLRQGSAVDRRRFFVARFARIYPFYIASLLLEAPFGVATRVAKWGVAIASLHVAALFARGCVMMQIFATANNTLNIPSWTIAIEAVFYLSFPWLGPAIWKLSKRGSLLAIGILTIGAIALSWLITSIKDSDVPAYQLGSFLAVFAAGICLARWQTADQQEGKPHSSGYGTGWLVILAMAAVFFTTVSMQGWLLARSLKPAFLLLPVYLALIWLLTQEKNYATHWLRARWLVILGEASYALYLLHHPLTNVLRSLGLMSSWWSFPLNFGVCLSFSVLSFYFFETPCRRWILRHLHTRTKETMEAASLAQ